MSVPLVCVAGTLCDGRLFGPMLAALDRDAHTSAVSHADVDEAACALLAEAPARFAVAGFSLGGFVAMAVAARAPERVAGVALLSSNARPDAEGNAPARRAQVEALRSAGAEAVIAGMWPGCVSRANAVRDDVRDLLVAMAADTPAGRHAAQAELAIARPDARPWLRTTAVPLLAIHGADDALCPVDRAEEAAGLAPRGSLAVLPGAGHFAPLEVPGEVAAALETWLEIEGIA